ncbi:MAG: NAD-dependent epimerase/dehydratase family protein [Acidimicrobiales bacterium]
MNILVVGGTRFLGRAIVDAALGRGHDLTLFNRGQTNPTLYPGLKTVRGDRARDTALLIGSAFDVAIDVAGMRPEEVRPMTDVLTGVGRYVFISTVSVYAAHSVAQVEGDAVLAVREGQDAGEAYGAAKAACEIIVQTRFGDRALVVRPGLIVGPHDPTDRFAYWPRRIARGGQVLAPGGPDHPVQFIDVRDLASWVVAAAEAGLSGVFNATGKPSTLGNLLGRCRSVVIARPSELVWVNDAALLGAGVSPWMGVPLWIAAPGWEAANAVSIDKALAAGLAFRPLDRTIADTLAWDLARGGPPTGSEGLSAAREAELLAKLAHA